MKQRDIRSVPKKKLADLLRWATENGENPPPAGQPRGGSEGGKKSVSKRPNHKKPTTPDDD